MADAFSYFYTSSGAQLPFEAPSPRGSVSKGNPLLAKSWNRNIERQTESIAAWRDAIARAESNFQPLRYDLQRIYREIILDTHLAGILRQRKSKVLARKLVMEMQGQDPQPLEARWLREMIGHILDARFFGYSLIELGDVLPDKSGLTWVKSRERHLVSPDARLWLSYPQILSGVSLDDPAFAPWHILVNTFDLGELNACVPTALAKRFVFTGWTEFAQVFGLPITRRYRELRMRLKPWAERYWQQDSEFEAGHL